ncbi:Uncharacterised protein [Vibrio cholerae]|nr:Uncharacterised protein [Vibrio cholerae]
MSVRLGYLNYKLVTETNDHGVDNCHHHHQ